jgi:signal transduction histidine kinase
MNISLDPLENLRRLEKIRTVLHGADNEPAPLAALADDGTVEIGAKPDLGETIERALAYALRHVDCALGAVHLLGWERCDLLQLTAVVAPAEEANWVAVIAGQLAQQVVQQGQPITALAGSLTADQGAAATRLDPTTMKGVGLPMHSRGQIWGVLTVFCPVSRHLEDEALIWLKTIADYIGAAVAKAYLKEREDRAVRQQEQTRAAYELHDAMTQHLYSVALFAEAAHEANELGQASAAQIYLAQISAISNQVMQEMRAALFSDILAT